MQIKSNFILTLSDATATIEQVGGKGTSLRHLAAAGLPVPPGFHITTNVGWTPLFPRATAVVTDVGAPLSHAAIIARELGISAVVGCGNATMLLKTGNFVRVDGDAGSVEVLERID